MRAAYLKKSGGALSYIITALACLVWLFVACGIPTAPYLPPVPSSSVQSPIGPETDYSFSIPEPDDINPEVFEGFEIYYKLFDPLTVDEKLDLNGDTSLTFPVSLTSLQRAGYVRLASSKENAPSLPSYPLISLAEADMSNAELRIQLQFSNVGGASPKTTYGNGVTFQRTLKNENGTRLLKGFSPAAADDDFAPGDSDLPQDFDPDTSFDIVIALYVLSYGNDFLNLSFNIHSTAVFLGNSFLRTQ